MVTAEGFDLFHVCFVCVQCVYFLIAKKYLVQCMHCPWALQEERSGPIKGFFCFVFSVAKLSRNRQPGIVYFSANSEQA
jgi:hypothetical protein